MLILIFTAFVLISVTIIIHGFGTMSWLRYLLARKTLADGDFGGSADARFYDRLLMFVWATLYGVGAIYLFEVFWPQRNPTPVEPG